MKYRLALMSTVAFSLLSAGASQAASVCQTTKLYRSCSSNANYGFCNGDLMCQMQAEASADFTCYTLKVPCAFNANDLGDVAFSAFRYPIAGVEYNVPRELAH